LILKRKPDITFCFVSISKQNVGFYSSFAVHERKTKQQCSTKLYWIGKKEHNICFFLNESKKRIAFDHKKNVDITSSYSILIQCAISACVRLCPRSDSRCQKKSENLIQSLCIVYFWRNAANGTPCVSYAELHCPCISGTPTEHSALLRFVNKFCDNQLQISRLTHFTSRATPREKIVAF
jgi:hypothetical protein